MILIHTQEYFLDTANANPRLEALVDFLGGIPAAPVFMFLMGVGWVYSWRSPQYLAQGLEQLAFVDILQFT